MKTQISGVWAVGEKHLAANKAGVGACCRKANFSTRPIPVSDAWTCPHTKRSQRISQQQLLREDTCKASTGLSSRTFCLDDRNAVTSPSSAV